MKQVLKILWCVLATTIFDGILAIVLNFQIYNFKLLAFYNRRIYSGTWIQIKL